MPQAPGCHDRGRARACPWARDHRKRQQAAHSPIARALAVVVACAALGSVVPTQKTVLWSRRCCIGCVLELRERGRFSEKASFRGVERAWRTLPKPTETEPVCLEEKEHRAIDNTLGHVSLGGGGRRGGTLIAMIAGAATAAPPPTVADRRCRRSSVVPSHSNYYRPSYAPFSSSKHGIQQKKGLQRFVCVCVCE